MNRKLNRYVIPLLLLGICASAYSYDNPVEGGTTQVVSNHWNVLLPWMMVGSNTESNRMEITGSGRVDNQVGVIGSTLPSQGNSVLVSGPGAQWNSFVELQVGDLGTSNRLEVVDGGQVQTDTAMIGNRSAGNQATVSGNGSVLKANTLRAGQTGAENELNIVAGGTVESATATIGYWVGADHNQASVSGAGSVWTNSGALNVGDYGSENRLSVLDGGRVDSSVVNLGVQTISSNNVVSVSGNGSLLKAPELNIGGTAAAPGGTENLVEVQNGGRIETTDLTIHTGNNLDLNDGGTFAINNDFNASMEGFNWNDGGHLSLSGRLTGMREQVYLITPYETMDGENRKLTLDGGAWGRGNENIAIGWNGIGNSVVVTNGGSINSYYGRIGFNQGSDGNSVLLTGSDSVWTNERFFKVGEYGAGNSLIIKQGADVINHSHGYIGQYWTASNNSVVVSGSGSSWENRHGLNIGSQGDENSLLITSGGGVDSSAGTVGGSGARNSVFVYGAGSVWSNRSNLIVGLTGSENLVEITSGGHVYSSFGRLGYFSTAQSNGVVVAGAGSAWFDQGELSVGYSGSGNRLFVADGGLVHNNSGYIGRKEDASNNMALVSGIGSTWINEKNLYVGGDYLHGTWRNGGSGNSLTISNGGWVLVGNVDTNNLPSIGTSGGLVVGDASGNAELIAANQSVIDVGYAYIGLSSNESGSVALTSGSVMAAEDGINVGHAGSENTLHIEDGSQVVSSGGTVGYGETADRNAVTVSGEGSLWDARGSYLIPLIQPDAADESNIYLPPGEWPVYQPVSLSVGYQGSSNHLSITDGGRVESSDSYIGNDKAASGNSVLVSGAGSIWNSGGLHIGYNGSENSLRIEDGGKVYSLSGTIGSGESANHNRVLVNGTGSEWNIGFQPIIIDPWPPYTTFSNSVRLDPAPIPVIPGNPIVIGRIDNLTVGQDGSHNRLEIEDGAFVENSDGIIGKNSNAWNNAVLVTGVGSEWSNTRDLSLGGYHAEYITGLTGYIQSEWRSGGRGNSLYVGDGGMVNVGRDMHNRNYSGIAIDPGSHINIASNYYQDATSALRFGVETNTAGAPLNALVRVGGTAEFEEGAKIEVASNVGALEFDRFYTNKLVEANLLIVGGITNANSLDLEQLDASGSLVDVLFWENEQDIYGLVGRKYLADAAGFDTNSMMGRLSKEIDDLSLLGNATANDIINTLNRMSGDQQNAQLTQLYTQGVPTYMHTRAMYGAQKQVMAHTRTFRSMSHPTNSMATTNATNTVIDVTDEQSLRGWTQGYGSWADHGASGAFSGFDQSIYGTVIGIDKAYGNVLVGAAGGYARSYLTQDNFDTSDAWTRFGILYAAFAGEKWFGDVNVSYGRSRIKTRSGTVFNAEGKTDAENYALYVGGGREIHLSDHGLIFTPEAALSAGYFDQDSYSDGYRDIDAYDRWSCQSRLGAALALQKQVGSVLLKPDVHAYWLHEFNSDTDQVGYSLTGGTGRYAFGMQAPDADILEAGVGIAAALTDRLEIILSVDGQHSDRTEAISGSGRILFRF